LGYSKPIRPHFFPNSRKNKGKGHELKAFLLITGLFLISAYMVGVLPGGIQW